MPVAARMERAAAWASPEASAPRRPGADDARQGRGQAVEHGPETTLTTSAEPPILRVHSFRATSRRTVPSGSVTGCDLRFGGAADHCFGSHHPRPRGRDIPERCCELGSRCARVGLPPRRSVCQLERWHGQRLRTERAPGALRNLPREDPDARLGVRPPAALGLGDRQRDVPVTATRNSSSAWPSGTRTSNL